MILFRRLAEFRRYYLKSEVVCCSLFYHLHWFDFNIQINNFNIIYFNIILLKTIAFFLLAFTDQIYFFHVNPPVLCV